VSAEQPGLARYPHVFRPVRLGPVAVRNRVYIPPHGIPLDTPLPGREPYRVPAAETAFYFAERAAGGVGLIFHSMQVTPTAWQPNLGTTPWFEESVPSYARVAERVQEHGAKVMAEVWYSPFVPKSWEPLGPDAPILGSSVGQSFAFPQVRRAMTHDEIARFVEDHAIVTRRLRAAGYDGVEVHASHGVLVAHFLSPYFNRRDDEYGGALENRVRLLRECLEAVRSELGPEMALGVRISVDELLPDGVDAAETAAILRSLASDGLIHFADLDVSVEPEQVHLMSTTFFEPKLHNADRVAALAAELPDGLALLAAPGRVTTIAEAESFLTSSGVDMVGAMRGHIAEPRLVANALEGREGRSRTCIAANHCIEAAAVGGFGCAVNAAAGKEERFGAATLTPAPRALRVAIVGGGPAGLEAARVAALRGHSVVVFERRSRLGGGVALWARLPGREHLATLPAWLGRTLRELEVDVRTGVDAGPDDVLATRPDVVVVATGAVYARRGESGFRQLPIDGWDAPHVLAPEAVLEGGAALGSTVVVVDDEGMHAAAGVAELAAAGGADVTYVTRQLLPAGALLVSSQFGYVVGRLRAAGVELRTAAYAKRIGAGTVTLADTWTGAEDEVSAETVVLATMREPVLGLERELAGSVGRVYVVGDALAPRGLREATYEGHRFGRVIGEPEMPPSVESTLWEPMPSLRPAELA
jgi:2,4-dienoyl-CoA reductase-like NADH-dependent reductase (Old Yellow Enzyme family)